MKLLYKAIFIPMLALLVAGCTSNTALRTSENDDLYYAASDKTTRPVEYSGSYSGNYSGAIDNSGGNSGYVPAANEVENPDYSTGATSGQTAVTNNYNYYDSDYSYGYSGYNNRSYRNYNYGYNSYYSPFGYSAAYCYNIYDPFWYPYCYPTPGFSISIGFGYGYGYPYYRPYGGYYGYGYGYPYGGYGGYYNGFYDGYYAGSGYGYGYRRVNYAPRTDRGRTPVNAPGNGGGRPGMPNRLADPGQPNRTGAPAGRPQRMSAGQPDGASPNRAADQPINYSQPGVSGRPQRDTQVRPDNYQFQQAQPAQENGRPVRPMRGQDMQPQGQPMQASPENRLMRGRDVQPQNQQPVMESQPQQMQPNRTIEQPAQRPAQENYSRPDRGNHNFRGNQGGGFNQPSFQNVNPGGGGFQRSGGSFGRPGR